MLVKELPKCIENKTFGNIKEFMVFVYEEQIVTEFGELTDNEVSLEMKNNLEEARKIGIGFSFSFWLSGGTIS